ncbi:MAG: formyltetrahydrofolate deformylase [Planctomycetota bacterium]
MRPTTGRLLISCPDATGVVAAVTGFLAEHRGNLLEADQHTDHGTRAFSMRVEFEASELSVRRDGFLEAMASIVDRFRMRTKLEWSDTPRRVAVLCSKQTHCVSDLLWRFAEAELPGELAMVVSNHTVARSAAEHAGVPFHHLPVTPETKPEQERAMLELLEREGIHTVVLARYMQVLSPGVVDAMPGRIINIHHSFLPAFAGAKPYHQAFDRGVKLIGATSHYVTAELDEGPIIAQQTRTVSHRDGVEDLVRKGRDLERVVLADAVRLHLEDKVLLAGHKTIVFG